jgi:ribosomal protein L30E
MDNNKTIDFKNKKENRVIYKIFIFITNFCFFVYKGKNNNKLYKILLILILSKIIEKEIIKFRIIKNTKICICTPVKNENRYIKEYVEHYKKYGVDKIFLYDNNEVDGERLENVIGKYIKIGLVEVIDYRGKIAQLFHIMNDCYQKNYQIYDWLIFFEVDEYIHLSNYTNVKLYLQRDAFKNCEIIYLNWVYHTDNNLIYYDNRPLHIRFPEVEPNARNNVNRSGNCVKSILRGHIPNIVINSVHKLTKKLKFKSCNGFGNPEVFKGIHIHNSDFRFYYIDHYYSKSVEEFVEKLNKGDVIQGQKVSFKYLRVKSYFNRNKLTLEKLNFIENHTKLNLTQFKNRLKNKRF